MVVLIMGVTGSGKTTIGVRLAADLGWEFCDADDLHPTANVEKMRGGVPLTDEDRAPWLELVRERIETNLRDGRGLVVACSALKAAYRERLLDGGDDVRLVYLKGDYEEIERRLFARQGHFMNPSLLRSQFDALEEPRDGIILDVAPPPRVIVARIREALNV